MSVSSKSQEEVKWNSVKKEFQSGRITLGTYATFNFLNNPRHLLHALSRYKFAAKMIGLNKKVLEVGCNDGFCTNILAEDAREVLAVDIDTDAILEANEVSRDKVSFKRLDVCEVIDAENEYLFDAAVSMDVIEHILPENENLFLDGICAKLNKDSICIIGTPNKTASKFASKASVEGHVNLFDYERLEKVMQKRFYKTLLFSMNDEVVHTGYKSMSHYFDLYWDNKK